MGQRLKCRMDAQCGRDEINEWRLISDRARAEEFRACDVAAATMGFDTPPIIGALQNVLAVFRDFQLDHNQPPILSQRQQIDRPDAELRSARGAKLRVQRRDDQTGIESGDVATKQ